MAICLCQGAGQIKIKAMSLESSSVLPHLKSECQSCALSFPLQFLNNHSGLSKLKAWIPQREISLFLGVYFDLCMYFFSAWKCVWADERGTESLLWLKWEKQLLLCKAVWVVESRPVIKVWVYCVKIDFTVFRIKLSELLVVLFVLWQGNYNVFPVNHTALYILWVFGSFPKAAVGFAEFSYSTVQIVVIALT